MPDTEPKSPKDQLLEFTEDTLLEQPKYHGPPISDNKYNGFPYIGAVIDFKETDSEDKKPQPTTLVHTRQLLSTSAADMETYTIVKQSVTLGKSCILVEEKQYDQDKKGWHILLCWADLVFVPPEPSRI